MRQRLLDDLGMSKAELARQISAKLEVVRRLFTGEGANPTMATVAKIADALNLRVELVPSPFGQGTSLQASDFRRQHVLRRCHIGRQKQL